MENKPVTLEDLRKDILRLQFLIISQDKQVQAQIKMLQDLVVSQGQADSGT